MYPIISVLSTTSLNAAQNMGILDALLSGLLGYIVVFIGLALLMVVVMIIGKIMVAAHPKSPVPNSGAAAVQAPSTAAAPGSAGQVKLYDVPDKEAALLMAIVADKMGKPLNELRFKSIKEVRSDEI